MELVQFNQKHFSTLSSWFASEAELVQWGGTKLRFPLDDQQMITMLEIVLDNLPDKQSWMAFRDGSAIGHAQLHFDWKNGNATLARVVIAPSLRGQKLAVPMLQLVMAEAFNYSQLMRLELNVYVFNQSAIRTYKRLGFVEEGIRKSSAAVGQERWDTMIMAILRSEFEMLYGKAS
jgi:RimJ/RimL family protein N-acetyltransferase